MLAGQNLVYLGPEPWTGLWRNRHWLMSLFARENQVLYVEPQRALRPTLADWRAGRMDMRPWHWHALEHIKAGLSVYHPPPFAPITGLVLARRLTRGLRRSLVRRAARQLGLRQPIIWISRPGVAELASAFEACLTIYHVVDEYSAYPGQSEAERARLRTAEQPLLRQADLVIVSSRALLEAKQPFNPHTYWVPNGANLAGYQQHLARGAPIPAELAAIPRPRLGYLGLIGGKLDYELLEQVALARPRWSLVFVGAVAASAARPKWERLARLSNVYYLGEVPASRVPEYVFGFDLGLMPYRRDDHVEYIDPLKLYDYLAAGLPVVSVELPALEGYRHVVSVGYHADGFVAAAEVALSDRGDDRTAERRRLVAANGWEERAEAISALIRDRLQATRMQPRAAGRTARNWAA